MGITKNTNRQKNITIIVSIIFLIVFIFWFISDDAVNTAGRIAAIISAVLFCYCLIWFIIRWHDEWFGDHYIASYDGDRISSIGKNTYVRIFFAFILLGIIELIIIHTIRVLVFQDKTTFIEGLGLFYHIDSGYYIDIAENWYVNSGDSRFNLVFYPGYPVLIMLVNKLIGNSLISGITVSLILYAGSACLLYYLLAIDYSSYGAKRGVKYLAILPGSFFFIAPMSESTFLFFSLITIVLVRKDKWILSVISGAFCAFTRSLGVLIIVPLMYHSITMAIKNTEFRSKWIMRSIICLIVPLGTVAYLIINYQVSGNPFEFTILEKEKWNQALGLFFDTVAFQIDNGLADIQQPYFTNALGIWFPNVSYILVSLSVMALASKYIKLEYLGWFICYFVIAIGVTYLISAPRYLIACVPLYPALTQITKDKKMDTSVSILCVILSIYYLFAFTARWEVF